MTNPKPLRKPRWPFVIGVLAIIFSSPLLAYPLSYQPSQAAKLAYQYADQREGYYAFEDLQTTTGLIYYPGGLVNPKAYAGFALQLAATLSINVYVVQPFLNLAITSIDAASNIMDGNPDVTTWVLAGHSLGGSSAAFYAHDHLDAIAGLIFLASYTTEDADFSQSTLPVLSITGSLDGILNQATYETSKTWLPMDTMYVDIAGGNHSQFGDYGFQRGDSETTLTRSDQFQQITDAIEIFLTSVIQ